MSFDLNEDGFPNQFLCPISHAVMVDPVVASDGHTYERKEIERWFSIQQQNFVVGAAVQLAGAGPSAVNMVTTSPVTGELLKNRSLVTSHQLRTLINEWRHVAASHGAVPDSTLIPGLIVSAQAPKSSAVMSTRALESNDYSSNPRLPPTLESGVSAAPQPQRSFLGPAPSRNHVTEVAPMLPTTLLVPPHEVSTSFACQSVYVPASAAASTAAHGTMRRQSWAAPIPDEVAVSFDPASVVERFAGTPSSGSRRLSAPPIPAWSDDKPSSAMAVVESKAEGASQPLSACSAGRCGTAGQSMTGTDLETPRRHSSLRGPEPVSENCGIFGVTRVADVGPPRPARPQSALWTSLEAESTKRHLMAGTALIYAHMSLKNIIPLKLLNEQMAKTARAHFKSFCHSSYTDIHLFIMFEVSARICPSYACMRSR